MATSFISWWQRHGLLVGLFAPPALWVAMRWWLAFRLETGGLVLAPALSPASDPDSVLLWLALGLCLFLVLGVLLWWFMRPSMPGAVARRWVGQGLLVLWVLVCALGMARTARSHVNRLELQPAREIVLKVVGVQVQPASVRSSGGAKVYLDWPAGGGLYMVLLESPSEDLLRKPAALVLNVAPGRWSGAFVTGWRVDNGALFEPTFLPSIPRSAP